MLKCAERGKSFSSERAIHQRRLDSRCSTCFSLSKPTGLSKRAQQANAGAYGLRGTVKPSSRPDKRAGGSVRSRRPSRKMPSYANEGPAAVAGFDFIRTRTTAINPERHRAVLSQIGPPQCQ
ncbi:hypothetical protein AAFF_G00057740 [Aldrovandia affinis]|uniref:Uncharacterized protein n=1 Tax=Aldrovandia affinis TaxID=143900 RepID=A0AAD7S0E8_9TELE|nr:hypothetical protein AAFF_G00057740 [Aldrovandia affinis]